MNISDFPGCCGIKIIEGFSYIPAGKFAKKARAEWQKRVDEDKKFIEETIEDQLEAVREANKRKGTVDYDGWEDEGLAGDADGILMAVLNNTQLPTWAEFLKTKGFKRVSTAINPKHNSTLNVFAYTVKKTLPKDRLPF